jgi:hypothetical protein
VRRVDEQHVHGLRGGSPLGSRHTHQLEPQADVGAGQRQVALAVLVLDGVERGDLRARLGERERGGRPAGGGAQLRDSAASGRELATGRGSTLSARRSRSLAVGRGATAD